MIIFGWRGRYKVIGTGHFHCPGEGGDRTYSHKEVRRWFTLFFLPVIPLNVLGDFIECDSCGRSYDNVVLTLPTSAQIMDNLAEAMRHVVVTMIRADDQVLDSEKAAAIDVMKRFSDTPYLREDLERDLKELEPKDLSDALAEVAGVLNDQGKESLLQACMVIAAADGEVDPAEIREITKAGTGLGMSPAHIKGVLAHAFDPVEPE